MIFQPYCCPINEPRSAERNLNRLGERSTVKDPIPLTGRVKGRRASDLEERFARGLTAAGLQFTFQYQVLLASSLPGQEKEIDFLVDLGWRYPVEIDGLIAHRTAAQQGSDLMREILLNHRLRKWGMLPIQRVKWWQLDTQEMADRAVRRMFGGGR